MMVIHLSWLASYYFRALSLAYLLTELPHQFQRWGNPDNYSLIFISFLRSLYCVALSHNLDCYFMLLHIR